MGRDWLQVLMVRVYERDSYQSEYDYLWKLKKGNYRVNGKIIESFIKELL